MWDQRSPTTSFSTLKRFSSALKWTNLSISIFSKTSTLSSYPRTESCEEKKSQHQHPCTQRGGEEEKKSSLSKRNSPSIRISIAQASTSFRRALPYRRVHSRHHEITRQKDVPYWRGADPCIQSGWKRTWTSEVRNVQIVGK